MSRMECQCKQNIEALQYLMLNLETIVDITKLAMSKYRETWIPYHVLADFEEISTILRFVCGKVDSLHYRVKKLSDQLDLIKEE